MKSRHQGSAMAWITVGLVILALGEAHVHAAGSPTAAATIRLDHGRVTARIASAPLVSVMEELGTLSGAQVQWVGEAGGERVSVEFTRLALSEAVARVLGARSYFLVYGPGGREHISRIVVMTRPGEARSETVPRPREPQLTREVEAADPNGLDPAVMAVLEDPNPDVRRQLLANLEALDEGDPRREAVLSRLAADPDPQVRTAALQASGKRRERSRGRSAVD